MSDTSPDSPGQKNNGTYIDMPDWAERFIDNFNEAVAVIDPEGNFLYWNKKAAEMSGYASDELGSVRFETFFEEDYIQDPQDVLKRARETGLAKAKLRVIDKNGRMRHLAVRCEAVKDNDGNIIAFTGVSRDITDQVEAEEFITAQRDIAFRLSGSDDLEEIFEWALPSILINIRLPCGAIHLFDKSNETLNLLCSRGFSMEFIDSISTLDKGNPAVALVNNRAPLFARYEEISAILSVKGNPDNLKAIGIVPIVHEEEVLGSLCIASRSEENIPERTRETIQSFLEIIGQGISRVRLANELRDSEERYRLFHDYSGVAILTADMDLKVVDLNPKACEVLGRPKEEIVGRTLIEAGNIIHPEDLVKSISTVTQLFDSNEPVAHAEIRYLRHDGSTGYADVTAAKLYKDGRMVGFNSIIRDVTERKLAEEVIKHSEEMFRQMFNYMSSGVVIYDAAANGEDFVFKDVNQAAERIDRIERGNVIGKPVLDVFKPFEKFGLVKLLREVWRTGDPVYHPPLLYNDGRVENWRDYYVYKLPSGEIVTIYDDLTEQRLAEDTIKKNAEDLKNLLDIAAHELRHPVAIFKGYSDMLRTHWKTMDKKAIQEALENIDTATHRLSNLVTELLDLSRIENDKLEIIPSRLRLSSSIVRATEEMRVRGFKNLFSFSTPEDEIEIYADFDKITKVMLLLLDNAIRYANPGSPVDLWVKQDPDGVTCYVADRGPGIKEEDREMIFNRFYQGESIMHHSASGIGLGLYIARSIVESHGGKIGINPREGGGSIFFFSIPATITPTRLKPLELSN